ncbi:MAG: GNAT family N-acetyltransferase [Chloroflexi bacterium]|nr:GNAT family N-acetyltransferase [Chloroflexota bacterium]
MTFLTRPYADAVDLQAMIDLLYAARPVNRLNDYPGEIDLREMLATERQQKHTRLWLTLDGSLDAFALVDAYNNLWFEMAATDEPQAAQIIQWGVDDLCASVPEADATLTLDTNCSDANPERLALLKQHGFVEQPLRTLHMTRLLSEPIPEPELPIGFTVRPIAGEGEAERVTALHQAAFGTDTLTLEDRLAIMRTPDYDPTLDLIVIAPAGELAGYCTCQINAGENARTGQQNGDTDPVAVHPAYQGRGLARALLLSGCHLLKQRGMDMAELGTSSENVAMQRAAEAAGFRVQSSKVWFARAIETDEGFQRMPAANR